MTDYREDDNWITVPGLFSIRSSRQKPERPASLYVLGMAEQPDHVKIGIATSIALRLSELQTANPFSLKLLASKSFPTKGDARRYEQELHQRFADCRAVGEWFRIAPHLREELIASMAGEA